MTSRGKLPLQYALCQVLFYFLERRNFQGTHVIQPDDMTAKGGLYRLLSEFSLAQLCQGFRKGLDIACGGTPFKFTALALLPMSRDFSCAIFSSFSLF